MIPYFDGEESLDLPALTDGLNRLVEDFLREHPGTRLILESGRYLVGSAGAYLVGVRSVKSSFGQRFAVTDGGTHHCAAAGGIGSPVRRNFPIRVVGREGEPTSPWTVTGLLCTPNDTLGKHVGLPELAVGDLIAIEQMGAYGPTASPGLFLSHGYPAEVLIHEGNLHLVRSRDDEQDLVRKQIHYRFDGRQRVGS
jgi:diaminopimelate decarboxylase